MANSMYQVVIVIIIIITILTIIIIIIIVIIWVQNTVYGLAARLPFRYTGAVVLGSVNIIFLSNSLDHQWISYFCPNPWIGVYHISIQHYCIQLLVSDSLDRWISYFSTQLLRSSVNVTFISNSHNRLVTTSPKNRWGLLGLKLLIICFPKKSQTTVALP